MAKIVVVGAGFAGHTAALYLGNRLGKQHQVTVVNRYDYFGFVPSWVWVGVGHMAPEKTTFKLKPVYDRMHVNFVAGKATEIHPDTGDQYIVVEKENGETARLDYDYLIVATGPKLNFEATPGLGPKAGNTHSICTLPHAIEARDQYKKVVQQLKRGEKVRIVIGTGHGGATCQGAGFEYLINVHRDLVKQGVREGATLTWLSNEAKLGDFGVGGVQVRRGSDLIDSAQFIQAVFDEYGIHYEVGKAVKRVEPNVIYWEDYDGKEGQTPYDFAMLIPQFAGVPLKYVGKNGEDVAGKLTNSAGLILTDGVYGLSYPELVKTPEAWPATYQNPSYPNIFAAGIAFAPPGPISVPHVTPNGTSISAAPPRTGMVAGIIGRIVALNVIDLVNGKAMSHRERMSEMFTSCIASMGDSLWDGRAVVINVYPVVPDRKHYQNETGRDLAVTYMEMGLSGAWMKRMIHETFLWKLRARPGWTVIPE